jgi:hypothetical protein
MPAPWAKDRSKLRFERLNAFVDYGADDAGLKPLTRLVWLVLYRHTRDDKVTVGIDILVKGTGLKRRAIQYALQELTEKRFLKTIRKGGLGKGLTTRRIAPISMAPKADPKQCAS